MKTMILCRHAKSDWPPGISDLHRPLKERGVEDATWLAGLLHSQGFLPDAMISSPAKRALDTADLLRKGLHFPNSIAIAPSLYDEGTSGLIQLLNKQNDQLETIMLFGHNPTMENTLTYLLGAQSAFEMPTCAMACLEMRASHWKELGKAPVHLRWLLVPRLRRMDD